ncbi:MAG TPA: alpha/beta fold hydrolase [Gemmatimonadaceae bacterium]
MSTAREKFLAFRRTLGRTPTLHRQTVRARGGTFAVFSTPPVEGSTPLACVNGGMLHDHTLLWPALAPLAHGRQVILYDQRGRGESPSADDHEAHHIEDDAADLAAIRRALGLRQWDLLGHSWGGGIAMLGASLDPAGTRRLVLVDAVGTTNGWMAPLRDAALARLQGDAHSRLARFTDEVLSDPDPAVHAAQALAIYPAWFADPDYARVFSPPRAASPTGAAVLAYLRRSGYDWRERVRSLPVPTLVIHGEADPLPPQVAEDTAALLPDARLALVPHAGHMPFWEQPGQFFPLVEQFLTPAHLAR